jgi:hypothetical protein
MSSGARSGAVGWRVTSRKVADSIPAEDNTSGHTMALGSTEYLTEISIRRISGGGGDKGGRFSADSEIWFSKKLNLAFEVSLNLTFGQ